MEVLLWESELSPKPAPHVITMPAQEGDLAWVSDEQKEYKFTGGVWTEVAAIESEKLDMQTQNDNI